ncbi:MAG: glycosyl hydrolase 53 family protein [Bacteroidales bacterium]
MRKNSFLSILFIILLLSLLIGCVEKDSEPDTGIGKPPAPSDTSTIFYRAMDLSFQPEFETDQVEYFNENADPVDMLPYMKNSGVNLVRLRLWHTPAYGHCGLEEVLSYAQRVKQAGMDILLDIHFSDTWADPGNQSLPAVWQGLSFDVLSDSVRNYTKVVITSLNTRNTTPVIVQIGNEINAGFLWNLGRVGGDFNDNWANYSALTVAAINGIKTVDPNNEIDIMIHYAGFNAIEWFLGELMNHNVTFDIIGISYYSIWHGNDLSQVQNILQSIAQNFSQKIFIAETSYPWTLEWNDWTNNIWGLEEQLIPGYSATPAGQKKYLVDLKSILKNLNGNKGIGFCYWAPDWVAYKGPEASDGSIWENATVFDFESKALPVMDVFSPD